jgi:hypothetical protein
MGKAKLLLSHKARQGRLMIEMVLWQLPAATPERPHGIKYRLYLGRDNETLVRYDNETGKGPSTRRRRGSRAALRFHDG